MNDKVFKGTLIDGCMLKSFIILYILLLLFYIYMCIFLHSLLLVEYYLYNQLSEICQALCLIVFLALDLDSKTIEKKCSNF